MHNVTNRQCVLNIELKNPLPEMTRKFGLYLQTNLFLSGDRIVVIHAMPDDFVNSREKDIFLTQFGAEKIDNIWAIRHETDDKVTESFIRDLIGVKSVVLDDVFLDRGLYRFIFRFNEHDQAAVSRTLLKGARNINGLNIEYLGESPPLLHIFKNTTRAFPLVYVEIKNILPREEMERKGDMPMGSKWAREIKSRTLDRGLEAVYHIHDPDRIIDESKVSVISSEDRIYGYKSENRLLNYWSKQLYENSITIMWLFQDFRAPEFNTAFIFPRFYVQQFFRIIESSAREFPDWKISVNLVRELNNIDED